MKPESTLNTDEGLYYRELGREYERQDSVKYERGRIFRGDAHTNTAESFFSIFKRGMTGIYQHCDETAPHRLFAEFDFRYSNRIALGVDDIARTDRALTGMVGKRLTYHTAHSRA